MSLQGKSSKPGRCQQETGGGQCWQQQVEGRERENGGVRDKDKGSSGVSGQRTAPGATAMAASNWSTSHPQYTQPLPLVLIFVCFSLSELGLQV